MLSEQPIPQRQSRLAWLTPLQISQCFGKSWVLTYTSSQLIDRADTPCTKVTEDALLLLLEATVDANQRKGHAEHGISSTFTSDCGRLEVHWRQQKSTAERLFVQQASDYFQRIELIIDGNIAAAFQEPVWPHLQAPRSETKTKLMIPTICIKLLESASKTGSRLPTQEQEVANSPYNDIDDQSAAA